MLVYLVGFIQALVYLASVPVCAAFCLSARDRIRFGVGVSAFERRFALRRARRFDAFPAKESGRHRDAQPWRVLLRLRRMGLSLRGRLCLGDAAATALACGALRALASASQTRERRVRVNVEPVFSSSEIEIELQGMIRARVGQIITAAARSGIDDLRRRMKRWKGIRSKAS